MLANMLKASTKNKTKILAKKKKKKRPCAPRYRCQEMTKMRQTIFVPLNV
jgi:hypothetical protein